MPSHSTFVHGHLQKTGQGGARVYIVSMKEERIISPKRAGATGKFGNKTGPSLDETLRYLIILLRVDCDKKETSRGTGVRRHAVEMGMELRRFQRYLIHPHWSKVREVVAANQSARSREKTFGHYVFKHLSPEAQKTWKELKFWSEHSGGQVQIMHILRNRGRKIRQELFIHALVSTHYDTSRALSMTGLAKSTLDHWVKQDFHFSQLMDEIQWHKKNFFEKAMMDLVADRNPLATVWVNKTVNADRGYSEKIQVQHSIADAGFTFEELDLDADTRRKVLDAIRKRQALKAGEGNGNGHRQLEDSVVDVDEVEDGEDPEG